MRIDNAVEAFLKLIFRRCYIVLFVCLSVSGCTSTPTEYRQEIVLAPFLNNRLDLERAYVKSEFDLAYLKVYNFDSKLLSGEFDYHQGIASVLNSDIRVQVFRPPNVKGTLFLLHGYFDHVGSLHHLINQSLSRGYAVVAYDLPGHGLSSGSPGKTGGIRYNASLLKAITQKFGSAVQPPFHVVGFSTGGSIVLEHLRQHSNDVFVSAVVAAPLLRHQHWNWGRFGYRLAKPFVGRIKHRDKQNSSNPHYLEFSKRDPLRSPYVDFSFLDDLYKWVPSFIASSSINARVLLLQGNQDKTVDWNYNLPLLKKKSNKSQNRDDYRR